MTGVKLTVFGRIRRFFYPEFYKPKGLSQPKLKPQPTTPIKKGVVNKKKRGTRKSRMRRH